MKFKRTVLLKAGLVVLALLLATGTAQAEPIVIVDGDTATHIQNLDVDGTLYNVAFLFISADELYGDTPVFDFPDEALAKVAKIAAVLALNVDNRATSVGPSAGQSFRDWGIGFEEDQGLSGEEIIIFQNATYSEKIGALWWDADIDFRPPSSSYYYADFSPAGSTLEPVTIGGSVSGLLGPGLVLQNNGTDDLSIWNPATDTGDGPFTFDTALTPGNSYNVTVATNPTSPAQICIVENGSGTVPSEPVTDVAVTCVEAPEPVTIGGAVSGLVGSGLVLQNTGRDDLSIAENGEFTFDTARSPGTFYDVTVANQPTNPAQTCSVANGSGTVPTTPVTDVAVTCVEPVLGSISKVAAEGETLPDNTVLTLILKDAGVAINMNGQVAFGGRDDDGTDAAFTQAGKVAEEGEILPDSTTLSSFRALGEVAISAPRSGDKVAFHGKDDAGVDTVFTQAGKVAAEGDALSEGTLDEIEEEGKVAINNLDQVAFHGRVAIEDGLFNEQFRAVFTSDGQTTQVAAREASALPDGTTLEEILESGGVAINLFGDVAFHGRVVDSDAGRDKLKAVFTSDGLAAREAATLPDGNTLDDINEDGGVAINLFGDVAFHGSVIDAAVGGDSVKAVLTQAGVVVKEGETLPDGTTLDEITVHSGVAINLSGDVVFHGRTGNVKAVFSQNGLVARVGDNLADGSTTLKEIWEDSGVAINTYGFEVAFHGGVENPDIPGVLVDAVFVGQAP